MVLPKNLGVWGFWIAIISLCLAYPVSLLANITSPRIQDWWAARSRRTLSTRIKILESQLTKTERNIEPNEIFGRILKFAYVGTLLLGVGVYAIFTCVLLGVWLFLSPTFHRTLFMALTLGLALVVEGLCMYAVKMLAHDFRHLIYSGMQDHLKLTITQLKNKLTKHEKH